MYAKVKYITEDEFQKMKANDLERTNSKQYRLPLKSKQNYYSNKRKKIQRTMNYYVRLINKNISNDYLWRGRFFIRQVESPYFVPFEDGSGAELFVTLRIFDKKTEKYIDSFNSVSSFCFYSGSRLAWLMNDAITKYFKAWDGKDAEDNPYKDRIDYSSIPDDYITKNSKPLLGEGVNIHVHP